MANGAERWWKAWVSRWSPGDPLIAVPEALQGDGALHGDGASHPHQAPPVLDDRRWSRPATGLGAMRRPGAGTGSGYPILLAEDDEATASIIRHRLERHGYVIRRVVEGEALEMLACSEPFALVILGTHLAGIDAFDLLGRLRQHDRTCDTPVLMLGADRNEQHLTRAFALGADDYLVKPFSPTEMVARVRRLS